MSVRDFAKPGARPANTGGLMPGWTAQDGLVSPVAPQRLSETGIDPLVLTGLAVKLASTMPSFTTQWVTEQLRLPVPLVEEICWQLKEDRLLEVLEEVGPFNYRYSSTQRGREQAARMMEISGYLGPAPVSLTAYVSMLDWQSRQFPALSQQRIEDALAEMVLPEQAIEVASLAAASGRSLFVFGPAGNGKTSLGRALSRVLEGELWIPHCIQIEHNIIRLFDDHLHQMIDPADQRRSGIDQRWVRIRRPFVVAGGEMTMEELDLAWSPSLRFYEAPPHVKANGGIFMIDDFGRQRIDPHELLNRWIIPLEHQTDHLALVTGQKIQIPFRLMLIVATNLQLADVADPAFLRRMGYRLHIDVPTPGNYARIFHRYAEANGIRVDSGLIDQILARYQHEGRELRASEPRDLLERTKDICRLRGTTVELDATVLDIAWRGYFGNSPSA